MRRWRLALLGVGAIGIVGGAIWRALAVRRALFERVERRLSSTAAVARGGVELWVDERIADARAAAATLGDAPLGARSLDAPTRRALEALRQAHGYRALWVLDRAGAPLDRSPGAPDLAPPERALSARVAHTGRWEIAGPFAPGAGTSLAITLAYPTGPAGGPPTGAVVVRLDPALDLLPLTVRHASRTGTEEGRLVALVGDSILAITPPARGSTGFVVLREPIADAPLAKRRAVAGTDTLGRYRNSQGRDVLAGLRHVRGTPWAVAQQVDVADEMEFVYRAQLRTEGLLLALAIAAVLAGGVAASRAERARRSAELDRERSLLRATLEATADGILVVDGAGRSVAHNERFLDLWRIPPAIARLHDDAALREHVLGQLVDPDAFTRRVDALYADPSASSDDVLEFRDGRRLERVSQPQRMGERIVGRVWSFRDITARERTLAALQASEASARTFVERSPYGICRVATDGRFTDVNPALAGMLGAESPAALVGTLVRDRFVDQAQREALVRRHLAGDDAVTGVEIRWRRTDGTELDLRIHSRAERGADGRIAYYEAFVEDLGPLRAAEQALRHAEKLAAVGHFVSGVAHELNNPLAAVLLFTEQLLEEDADEPTDHETLALVRDQALRARSIVRDLLAFVRGADGERAFVVGTEVLERIGYALQRQFAAEPDAARRIRLVLDIPSELGWLHVDRVAIEQVVTNLVENAVQANPGGTVRLRAAREGAPGCPGWLRVTVEDEGPGIPAQVLPRIFEPFFTTKPVGAGTGLGLSVSLGIAERHGGALTAENRPAAEGGGARLTLRLPLAPRPPRGTPPAPAWTSPAAAARSPDVAAVVS